MHDGAYPQKCMKKKKKKKKTNYSGDLFIASGANEE